jgi:hypothetical protein
MESLYQDQTALKQQSNRAQTAIKPRSNSNQTALKQQSNRAQTAIKPRSNSSIHIKAI